MRRLVLSTLASGLLLAACTPADDADTDAAPAPETTTETTDAGHFRAGG